MVLTAYIALSPEIGLSCLRRLRRLLRKLDASVEESGPHDFAVCFSAVRYRHLHIHRIPLRVRDDREPPLMWNETAIICEVIWVGGEQKYFCKRDWTDSPNQHGEGAPKPDNPQFRDCPPVRICATADETHDRVNLFLT
jgi:diadenosine tetraphosphate (Ap4A) HIT family hydrolase